MGNLANKVAVETLLRDRKLDRTLTTAARPDVALSAFDHEALDRCLRGLPRGQVSEVVGPASSGRTSLAWAALAAATCRGEVVSLVDTFDRFDPPTAAAAGVDLSRLLWVRGQAISRTAGVVDPAWLPGVRAVSGPGTLLERTIDRALKALNLVVQSGVCTLAAIDLVDIPASGLTRIPPSTWLRFHRIVEGTETAMLLIAAAPITRSPGGMTVQMSGTVRGAGLALSDARRIVGGVEACEVRCAEVRWRGTHDRSRRLGGIAASMRAVSPRGTTHGSAATVEFAHT
jgi:hypothetical protein